MFKPMVVVGVVGSLWMPAQAICATEAPPTQAAVAPAASSPTAGQHRMSPFALAARQQAEAASAAGHAAAVPPSMRRTRGAVGRMPPQ